MAVTGREQALAEAGRVTARVASFRQDANATLLGVEGTLKALAGARRLNGAWVMAFFPPAEKAKAKKAKKGGGEDGDAGASG